MPAMVNENVPTSLASHLSVYSDGLGDMKILGLGWTLFRADLARWQQHAGRLSRE